MSKLLIHSFFFLILSLILISTKNVSAAEYPMCTSTANLPHLKASTSQDNCPQTTSCITGNLPNYQCYGFINNVSFGPVQLINRDYREEGQLEITVRTTNPTKTYTFSSDPSKEGTCPPRLEKGPCIGEQKLESNNGEVTHVEIVSARRVVDGSEYPGGGVSISNPSQAQWDAKVGQSTGWVTYQWTPIANIGRPEILLNNPQITTSQTLTGSILFPAPRSSSYTVEVVNEKDRVNLGSLTLNCPTEQCSISGTSTLITGVAPLFLNPDNKSVRLEFNINGAKLVNNRKYTILVNTLTVIPHNGGYAPFPVFTGTQAGFTVLNPETQALKVKTSPANIDTTTPSNSTVSVILENGTNDEYTVESTWSNDKKTFICTGINCSYPLSIGNIGLKPGEHIITITKTADPGIKGSAILKVEDNVPKKDTVEIVNSDLEDILKEKPVDPCKDSKSSKCTHVAAATCKYDFKIGNLNVNTDAEFDGIETAIGCVPTKIDHLVAAIFYFSVGIGGGIAFMLMLFAGFQMITSAGNPQNLKGAQDMFTNAIIGLLFIIFSVLLYQFIGAGILRLPGFFVP